MVVYGLPCQRERHDDCAGQFALGFAAFRRRHECECTCHFEAVEAARDEYVRLLTHTGTIDLIPS